MLHPNRAVDVILNMDASSDVQKDSLQQRVSQIGYRRGLEFKRRHDIKPDPDTANPDRFKGLYAQIYDGRPVVQRPDKVIDSYGTEVANPPAPQTHRECTMIYLPLLPNERAVPGYDPSTAKFSGSYNLVWTPEQIDMIIKTSVANFNNGQDTVKEALLNAWQRKKYMREQGVPPPPPPAGTTPAQGHQPSQPGQSSASLPPPVPQLPHEGYTQNQGQVPSPRYPQYQSLPDGSPIPPPPPYHPEGQSQGYPSEKQ